MAEAKILIVEDEPKVAEFIRKGLEEKNFQPVVVANGEEAISQVLTNEYDLVILDINIPGINGFEVCRIIRENEFRIPVLMLTALGSTDEKIRGFDTGADDYLVKPFEFRELVARINSLLKRARAAGETKNILRVADLELDVNSKVVKRNNKIIELTSKEFYLLEYLVRNKGKVVSRADIAAQIWDITFETGTNVIDVYVNFLRKKIDRDFSPKLIHTQIGMGYVIKEG